MTQAVVPYETGRQMISDGDIVFIANNSTIISRIIHFFTRSNYSHVGIAFSMEIDGTRRALIVEHQSQTRKQIVNLSVYSNVNLDVYSAPIPWEDVSEKALDRVGQAKYSLIGAGYIGLREFLMKYTKFLKLPRLNFPGKVCSEFVSEVYKMDRTIVSPQLLSENLVKTGSKLKIQIR